MSDLPGNNRRQWLRFLPVVALAAIWVDLVRQLSYTWSTNDQYAYGWFVPVLALGLFFKKWPTRPAPERLSRRSLVSLSVGGFLLTLWLLPLRVVFEVNQDWPLISWLYAVSLVAVSLGWLSFVGGWAWVKHFAFPVCFILAAVQWPYKIEHTLTQGLMRVVAAISVELLGLFDIPALQRGNLIELASGVVGIDEACSGIRSFQSTLMAALFLGELNLFRWPMRLFFVALGLLLAFVLNVGRAFFLAWKASSGGLGSVERWHDSAGLTIVLICFVCLWLLAWFLRRKSIAAESIVSAPGGRPALASLVPGVPGWTECCFAAGLLCVLLGTEAWYRIHEAKPVSIVSWSVAMPNRAADFRPLELSPKERAALKCDQSQGGSWTDVDAHWSAWWFRWNLHSMKSLVAARCHRPEVCLPASGRNLQANLGLRWYEVGHLKLPFRRLAFENGPQPLYVFFCLWQDGIELFSQTDKLSIAGRVSAALNGRRMLGQQTLEIICTGYPSFEATEAAFVARLRELVQIGSPGPGRAEARADKTGAGDR